jgi:hypothetical protein
MKTKRLRNLILTPLIGIAAILVGNSQAHAGDYPFAIGITGSQFVEQGNDVVAHFSVRTLAQGSFDALPTHFEFDISLFEDDIIFDDFLGKQTVSLQQTEVTQNQNGGWEKSLNLTFLNASNAFTGFGDDYILKQSGFRCSPGATDCNGVDVPGPLPLLGAAAAFGYSRKLRKSIKASKPEVISRTAL